MPRPMPTDSDAHQLRDLYRLEKGLADRLRAAGDEERGDLYGEVYDRYFSSLPEGYFPRPSPEQTILQKTLISPFLRPDTVFLEIGSGDGALARSLAPEVGEVWTIEASAVVAEGGEIPASNFHHLLPRDAEQKIPKNSIDLAFSCHFLEHLHPRDLSSHLESLLGWLKPGAPYVAVTPNRLHGPHDISGYFSDTPEGFHLREYSFYELAKSFSDAGFSRVEALIGVDRDPVRWPIWPIHLVESGLDLAGSAFRKWLFDRCLAHRAPFRPLEQVKIVGWKR